MVNTDGLNLKGRIDEFFRWFEENKFENNGVYCKETNLVLSFCDMVNGMDDYDLAECLHLTADIKDIEDAAKVADKARNMINDGTCEWMRG